MIIYKPVSKKSRAVQNLVIMVDDFKVEDDAGYGFDDYGNHKLDLKLIRPVVRKYGFVVFYPAISSATETGACQGCVILGSGDNVVEKLRSLSTIREYKIVGSQTLS